MPAITIAPKNPSTPAVSERLAVSVKEAAAMLSVSEKTLRNWTKRGKLRCCQIEGRVLYPLAELRRLVGAGEGEQ